MHIQVLTARLKVALRQWKKVGFHTENSDENNDGDRTCYVFTLEEPKVYLANSNPSRILTIEKQASKLWFYSPQEQ